MFTCLVKRLPARGLLAAVAAVPAACTVWRSIPASACRWAVQLAVGSYCGDDLGGAYALGRVLLRGRCATVVKPPEGGIAG